MTEPNYIGVQIWRPAVKATRPRDIASLDASAPKHRAGERFKMLNTFVDVKLRNLDPTAAVVWLILYRDTKPNGLARTSQTDIARRAGVSVSTVYRALRRLLRMGILVVVRKGRLGAGCSTYRIQSGGSK